MLKVITNSWIKLNQCNLKRKLENQELTGLSIDQSSNLQIWFYRSIFFKLVEEKQWQLLETNWIVMLLCFIVNNVIIITFITFITLIICTHLNFSFKYLYILWNALIACYDYVLILWNNSYKANIKHECTYKVTAIWTVSFNDSAHPWPKGKDNLSL